MFRGQVQEGEEWPERGNQESEASWTPRCWILPKESKYLLGWATQRPSIILARALLGARSEEVEMAVFPFMNYGYKYISVCSKVRIKNLKQAGNS